MLFLNRISQKCSLVAQQTKSIFISFNRMRSFEFCLGEIKRPVYAQLYPAVLVKPDGSTIRIKYHEPIGLINLPLDLATLEESARKKILLKVKKSNFFWNLTRLRTNPI